MWTVYEHRRVVKRLERLPKEIQKRYEKWKDIVHFSGPAGLRLIKGFHDEVLSGEWKGNRSSRLEQQFRVLYEVVAQKVLVKVIDVSAHDYRRKR